MSVKVEGNPTFVKTSLEKRYGDVINSMPERNPARHLLIDAIQRRLVHNAMALGRAMKRKVIMPKMYCWCDRFWNPMTDCRMPGVSKQQLPLPFHCPFDHVYDLEKWMHSEAPFREYSFLNSTRIPKEDKEDVVYLTVSGASDGRNGNGGGGSSTERKLVLQPGTNYADAAAALKKSNHPPYVVDVSARSLELLCEDLGSTKRIRVEPDHAHCVRCGRTGTVQHAAENPTYDRAPNDEVIRSTTWGFQDRRSWAARRRRA